MEVEKINKKPTLSLNYIFENKNPTFSKVIIENREYSLEEVNNREIQINFTEIEEELGETPTVVATGGLAAEIITHCRRNIIYNENLLLDGLRVIYEKNN